MLHGSGSCRFQISLVSRIQKYLSESCSAALVLFCCLLFGSCCCDSHGFARGSCRQTTTARPPAEEKAACVRKEKAGCALCRWAFIFVGTNSLMMGQRPTTTREPNQQMAQRHQHARLSKTSDGESVSRLRSTYQIVAHWPVGAQWPRRWAVAVGGRVAGATPRSRGYSRRRPSRTTDRPAARDLTSVSATSPCCAIHLTKTSSR